VGLGQFSTQSGRFIFRWRTNFKGFINSNVVR
jgi:hypothetical protein